MLRMLKVYLAAQGNAWVPSNHEVVGHNKLSKWGGTMHTAAKNGALQSDHRARCIAPTCFVWGRLREDWRAMYEHLHA